MERPNTVHGLIAKRRYLVATDGDPADIAAIDRVLSLFGAELDARALRPMRIGTSYKATKGEMQRLVFAMIREAGRPITSPEIAARYCERHNVPLELHAAIKSRVITRLTKMRQAGDVQKVVIGGRYRGWVLASIESDLHPVLNRLADEGLVREMGKPKRWITSSGGLE